MKNKFKIIFVFFKSIDAFYHVIGLGGLLLMIVKVIILNDIDAPYTFMSKSKSRCRGRIGLCNS